MALLAGTWQIALPSLFRQEYFKKAVTEPDAPLLTGAENETGDKSNSGIDGGWTRLSVCFTAPADGSYTVSIVSDGVTGSIYADDLQLESGDTPSTLNLLRNANMQYWDDTWVLRNAADAF